jgi:hypothetical protein
MNTTDYSFTDRWHHKLVLRPFGLDRETSLVLWMLLIFTALTFGSLYYFDGDLPVTFAIVYITGVFFITFLNIQLSFFIFMAGVMLFEQYGIPGFETFTHHIGFFSNLKEIRYLPFFEAGMVSPAELHLIFLCSSLLIQATVRRDFEFIPIPVWFPFLFFYAIFVFSFLNGVRSGGDFLIALWEVRALFYLAVIYIIVPQIISTSKQIRILFWIFMFGIMIKGLQGGMRFVELGYTTGGFDVLTNHEDPVFMVTIIVLLLGLIVFKTDAAQRRWILFLLIPYGIGFYVAQRRAAYAALMVSVAAFILLLPPEKRARFFKYFLPVLIMLTLYGAAFWNSTSPVGRPVQLIKSGIEKPELETNARDYYSNLYRDFENYNLAKTAERYPRFGTGFGHRYDQPIPLANIRFPLKDYIPHNQILWVYVKMGTVGFFAFWFFFHSFAAKGTQVFMKLKDPYLKAVTAVIVIAVINQMVVSYFDLQLTYYRNMLYLGCLMGLLGAIQNIAGRDKLYIGDDYKVTEES